MARAHIIERQVMHVVVTRGELDGIEMNRRLSALCRGSLPRALESVLDRFAPADGDLIVPMLEIDVGTLDLDAVEEQLTAAIVRALGDELGRRMAAEGEGARRLDRPGAVIDALVHFLRSGRLPWWFARGEARLQEVVLAMGREEWGSLRSQGAEIAKVLRGSARSRRRFVRQLSETLRRRVVAAFASEAIGVLDRVIATWRLASARSGRGPEFEAAIWSAAVIGATGAVAVTEESLVASALRLLPDEVRSQQDVLEGLRAAWPAAAIDDAVEGDGSLPRGDAGTSSTDAQDDAELRDGLFVENAGLVLLHPFLPRLFSYLEIADDERVLQPDRAVALLHFIASGSDVAPEYELVLAKILCGVPVDEPVEYDVALTDVERAEAIALLEAVIGHWSALRSTTPDGLRGSFLMRPGKVSVDAKDEWRVQVETRTYDILLDALPWGIAMFRLPWMDRVCRVEWNT
jgi:hypothetical protein